MFKNLWRPSNKIFLRRGGILIIPNIIVEIRKAGTDEVLGYSYGRNLVVDAGLNEIRDLLGGSGFEPDEMAVGSNNAAVQSTDTALGTETFRKAIDRRIPEEKKVTFQILLTANDGNGTLREAGLFEQSTLYARALISPEVEKTTSIDVTISHEITIASS
jgi:hypothetical protein